MSRRGFTLLELLIALAVAGIIAVTLAASLRIAFRARASAEAAVGPVRTAELALAMLKADIESTLPPSPSNTATGTTTGTGTGTAGGIVGATGTATGALAGPFVGTQPVMGGGAAVGGAAEADTLEFYTTAGGSSAAGTGGVRRVFLTLAPDPAVAGRQVLLRRTIENLLAPVEPVPTDEILCRGVRAFNLRYFDGFQWLETWDSTLQEDQLPVAVEVTLELEPTAGQPALVEPLPDASAAAGGIRFTRVFLLSCSTLSAQSMQMQFGGGGVTP